MRQGLWQVIMVCSNFFLRSRLHAEGLNILAAQFYWAEIVQKGEGLRGWLVIVSRVCRDQSKDCIRNLQLGRSLFRTLRVSVPVVVPVKIMTTDRASTEAYYGDLSVAAKPSHLLLRECGTANEGKLRRSSKLTEYSIHHQPRIGYMPTHSIPGFPGLVVRVGL